MDRCIRTKPCASGNSSFSFPSHLHQINIALPPDQQHGDEDLPPCCCRLRYGNTLVKPPPTPTPMLLAKPPEMAAPLPIEAAPLTALL